MARDELLNPDEEPVENKDIETEENLENSEQTNEGPEKINPDNATGENAEEDKEEESSDTEETEEEAETEEEEEEIPFEEAEDELEDKEAEKEEELTKKEQKKKEREERRANRKERMSNAISKLPVVLGSAVGVVLGIILKIAKAIASFTLFGESPRQAEASERDFNNRVDKALQAVELEKANERAAQEQARNTPTPTREKGDSEQDKDEKQPPAEIEKDKEVKGKEEDQDKDKDKSEEIEGKEEESSSEESIEDETPKPPELEDKGEIKTSIDFIGLNGLIEKAINSVNQDVETTGNGIVNAMSSKEIHELLNSDASKAFFESAKKNLGVEFYVSPNGGTMNLIKDGQISRPFDTKDFLRGNAMGLAAACKDVGLEKAGFKGRNCDSKYVMVAMCMLSKFRKDNFQEGNYKIGDEVKNLRAGTPLAFYNQKNDEKNLEYHVEMTKAGKKEQYADSYAAIFNGDNLGMGSSKNALEKNSTINLTDRGVNKTKEFVNNMVKAEKQFEGSLLKEAEAVVPAKRELAEENREKLQSIQDTIQSRSYACDEKEIAFEDLPKEQQQALVDLQKNINTLLQAEKYGFTQEQQVISLSILSEFSKNEQMVKDIQEKVQEAANEEPEIHTDEQTDEQTNEKPDDFSDLSDVLEDMVKGDDAQSIGEEQPEPSVIEPPHDIDMDEEIGR